MTREISATFVTAGHPALVEMVESLGFDPESTVRLAIVLDSEGVAYVQAKVLITEEKAEALCWTIQRYAIKAVEEAFQSGQSPEKDQ
jgi:hypothetical protein